MSIMNGATAIGEWSPRCTRFVEALQALCREHGVCLSVSGYDGLQVWDARESRTEVDGHLHAAGIEDRTAP